MEEKKQRTKHSSILLGGERGCATTSIKHFTIFYLLKSVSNANLSYKKDLFL